MTDASKLFGGSSGNPLGTTESFLSSMGDVAGYLDRTKVHTVLQSAYPDLFTLVGIQSDTDVIGAYAKNTSVPNTTDDFWAVAGNDSNWVMVGNGGVLWTCDTDPATDTWTARTSGTTSVLRLVITDGTTWAVSGDGTDIFTATDPTGTWTEQTGVFSQSMYGGTYGNGWWVMVGNNGHIWTATDPTSTWTQNTSPGFDSVDDFKSILYQYDAGIHWWVAVGDNGTIWTCKGDPNGTWVSNVLTPDTTTELTSISYRLTGGYWIITRSTTGMWYTTSNPDGAWTNWAGSGWPLANSHHYIDNETNTAINVGGSAGGESTDAWTTWVDNASLTAETSTFNAIDGNGRHIVAIGYNGIVWVKSIVSYNTSTQFYVKYSPAFSSHTKAL